MTTFLIDLGSHTVKIGTVDLDESSDDLLSMSQFSTSNVEAQRQLSCNEIPTLMGWPKITNLHHE